MTLVTPSENRTKAQSLLAEILGSPSIALPRRQTLVDWLEGYLRRSEDSHYVLDDTESSDLVALSRFLRKNGIVATSAS